MKLSGMALIIKPTQPKAQRPLSQVAADEQKRLDAVGPSDGMTDSQVKQLLETVQTASDAQLAELRKQFKINQSGTFANETVNMVRAEIDSIKAEVNQVKEAVLGAISELEDCLTTEAETQVDRHSAITESLSNLSDGHVKLAATMATDLQGIAQIIQRREASSTTEMEQINTRLDMLQEAILSLAGMAISSPRPVKKQAPMAAAQDSDDSGSETTLDESTSNPGRDRRDDVLTGSMIEYPDQLSGIKLDEDLTAEECILLVQALNRITPPSSTYEWCDTVRGLLPIGIEALRKLQRLASKNKGRGKEGSEAAKVLTALQKLPPAQRSALAQSQKENVGPHQTQIVPETPPKAAKRSAEEAGQRSQDMPGESDPGESMGNTAVRAKKSPSNSRSSLPDCTLDEAMDHIAFLQGCYPEHRGFDNLSQGDEHTLVARGNKARRILMNETPQASQNSDDSEKERNHAQAVKYQQK
jgi:uncharacterized protein YfkK (UPF0435 family)